MSPVEVRRGASPVILGLPHTGTGLPGDIRARLNANGRLLADTDWHIHTLYDGLLPEATTVRATFHRYVIDANRDPSGAKPLPRPEYHRADPADRFRRTAASGRMAPDLMTATSPDGSPISTRPIMRRWRPRSSACRPSHGVAILYDCHSIRSVVPFLFEGRLPDFNIGTNGGLSCAAAIETATRKICAAASGYSHVVNGRFKGGWTTRHYGRPGQGVHAIQMELTQATHLAGEAPPFAYSPEKAGRLRVHLRRHPRRTRTHRPRTGRVRRELTHIPEGTGNERSAPQHP